MRKGQSALEYLVTYGWAILAIVIIAALFWAFFRPSSLAGQEQITGFSGVIPLKQSYIASTNLLYLVVQNGQASAITIFNVSTNSTASNSTQVSISAGGTATLTVPGTSTQRSSGDAYSEAVTIAYNFQQSPLPANKASSGQVSGTTT